MSYASYGRGGACSILEKLRPRIAAARAGDPRAETAQTECAARRLRDQAEQVVPLVKRVIAQTRSRVLEGKKEEGLWLA